jgi:hypothetical protein
MIIIIAMFIVGCGLIGFGCCLAFDMWQDWRLYERRHDDGRTG